MSSIDKLLIRGIRSFDPDTSAVIEFYSPVTLIVGHNGAGKTSIIECLKYATTGDLPPNAKGGAFVHDPKLCGESEVKGQVKLKFKNVRGQSLVVTRSLQSTLKRGGKLEQKTLESLLVTTDPVTNEQVSISSRVAELDAEIPVQLGVSKAILEDVIFCHQEESQWPLSEPAALKKRFDDLFAATRYTRALEALKSSRKDLLAELRLEQQKLDFYICDREKAIKLQASINLNEKAIEEFRRRIEQCNANITLANNNIAKLQEELSALSSAFNELDRLSNEMKLLESNVAEMEVEVGKELQISDIEIQEELDRFSRIANDHQGEVEKLEYKQGQLIADLSSKQQLINSLLAERGVVNAVIEESVRKKTSLESILSSLCNYFGVNVSFDDKTGAIFEGELEKCKLQLEKFRKELENLSVLKSNSVSDLNSKISLQEEMRRIKRQTLDTSRNALIETIGKLEELESSESQVDDIKQRLSEAEVDLNRANDSLSAFNYDQSHDKLISQKHEIENEIKSVNMAIAEQSENAESRAKYDIKLGEQRRKQEIVDKLLSEFQTEAVVCGIKCESSQIDRDVEQVLREKEKAIKSLQEEIEKVLYSATQLSNKRDHLSEVLQDKEKAVLQMKQRIELEVGNENVDSVLEDCEVEYKELLETTADLSSMVHYADKMKQTHSCPVCERAFADIVEEKCVVQRVERKCMSLDDIKSSKEKIEKRLSIMRKLKPISDELCHITKVEINELTRSIDNTVIEIEKKEIDIQDLKSSLSKLQLDEKRLQSLKRKAEEIVRIQRELRAINEDVSFLERTVNTKSASTSELRGKLQDTNEKLRSVNSLIDSLDFEQKSKINDYNTYSSRCRSLKDELLSLQLLHSGKHMLESKKTDMETIIRSLENEIQNLSESIVSLNSQLKNVSESLSAQYSNASNYFKDLESNYEQRRQLVALYSSQYSDFLSLGNPQSRFEMVERQLRETGSELEQIQASIDIVSSQLQSLRNGASDSVNKERALKDNIKLRDLRRRLVSKRSEYSTLESKLASSNKSSRSNELTKQQLLLSDMMGERSGISGELRQLEEQSSRLKSELSKEYPNIEERFQEQSIRVKASEMAADDLERYAKALDQAIIRYHAAKMDEVNRTLRELWSAVYTGSDIDAVEIRADQEGTVAGHRSYNYRVVMVKGQVELDMRGRSSAGQRVLTSLLIRLALADTFASHCGVLALDEPTTNLDRDNIAALAEALADLIRSRKEQNNFQLIVITHDEEFVEALARHDCAEHYWRISKNSKQCSVIERQTLNSF